MPLDADLGSDALEQAPHVRRPESGLVNHNDHGVLIDLVEAFARESRASIYRQNWRFLRNAIADPIIGLSRAEIILTRPGSRNKLSAG